MTDIQKFGGDWTQEKLARIRSYLGAYTTVLKKQPFKLIYIDAFAGTGYTGTVHQSIMHRSCFLIFLIQPEHTCKAYLC